MKKKITYIAYDGKEFLEEEECKEYERVLEQKYFSILENFTFFNCRTEVTMPPAIDEFYTPFGAQDFCDNILYLYSKEQRKDSPLTEALFSELEEFFLRNSEMTCISIDDYGDCKYGLYKCDHLDCFYSIDDELDDYVKIFDFLSSKNRIIDKTSNS